MTTDVTTDLPAGMALYLGQERRRSARVPLCLPVTADCDAWTELCFSKDLSSSGAFLISAQLPTPAAGFTLRLRLPCEDQVLSLLGTVTRLQGATPRGFGVEWHALPPGEAEAFARLLARWHQAFGNPASGACDSPERG